MEDSIITYEHDDNVPAIADDSLLRVAEMAERRIDAVIKIKQMTLKVTNAGDWVDQNGKPYLQVSGSEKVANLFNISWRLDEPTVETEDSGHYTYTMRGIFSIPGRSISAEGSRSTKDPFFKSYTWENNKKIENPITSIDRRDVRMSALTNLLGNGITRLLGIRNLSYDDLEKYAGITKAMIGVIDYKKKDPLKDPVKKSEKPPETKQEESEPLTVTALVTEIRQQLTKKDGTKMKSPLFKIVVEGNEYKTFDKKIADTAKTALDSGVKITLEYTTDKYGYNAEKVELNVHTSGMSQDDNLDAPWSETQERDPGMEG